MFKIRLSAEEMDTLKKVLTYKVKEIHAWRKATRSHVRDKQYDKIATLLKRLTDTQRIK